MFEAVDDISIVAAPRVSSEWLGRGGATTVAASTQAINLELVTHCERMRYRIAALDTPAGLLPGDALDFRNLRSSTHAALYYPWLLSHPSTTVGSTCRPRAS